MLFNEPKLLKSNAERDVLVIVDGFSALQRAEIAEISTRTFQRARASLVSVLFNEPKLLKSVRLLQPLRRRVRFSALQRAEIAEIQRD